MRTLIRVAVAIALTATAVTTAMAPATAASPYKVTVTIAQSAITLGQSASLSGRVTGGAVKGKTVALYTRSASLDEPWQKIGTAKLSSTGRYKKSYRPTDGGPRLFRVIKSAGSGHGKGVAYSGSLDVFQWKSLQSYKDVATFGDTSINGSLHRGALLVTEGSPASFTTSTGECTRFSGTIGVDVSSAAEYGSVTLSDAFLTFFATYTVGRLTDGRSVTISLDTTKDLSFLADFPGSDTTSEIAIVGARVYCNSPL